MRVLFTPQARTGFLAAIEHILRENPTAARRFRRRAGKALRRLSRYPASGRSIPEFTDLPHREVVVAPYRFFYRVVNKEVWVVAVWHGARLPDSPDEPI